MTDHVDAALAAHKFSPDGSIFAPETLQDVKCRLSFIEASECNCAEGPHENTIHDLAHDDVPVLLKVIEQQQSVIDQLRAHVNTARVVVDLWRDWRDPSTGEQPFHMRSFIRELDAALAPLATERPSTKDSEDKR